ncbi:hypothetical protein [Megasphaera hominis]|jgi:hypothetical protein|uniref:Uncharacterized protein n=1 Tax=Megasphaera hominis TaxID=159836 RepID=A0ABR6VMQ4_9FIRM|nr:hypothetical protein [Megasphaera hominis]MBC3537726.1 hypothetical protein [Megasphaera hominis]
MAGSIKDEPNVRPMRVRRRRRIVRVPSEPQQPPRRKRPQQKLNSGTLIRIISIAIMAGIMAYLILHMK